MIPLRIIIPCGSITKWDHESEMKYRKYRCESCFVMPGSIGQPDYCKEQSQKWKNLEALGGQGWDYSTGKQMS